MNRACYGFVIGLIILSHYHLAGMCLVIVDDIFLLFLVVHIHAFIPVWNFLRLS